MRNRGERRTLRAAARGVTGVLLLVLAATSAAAQSLRMSVSAGVETPSLEVRITDSSGASIPGATVTAVNEETGAFFTDVSDGTGSLRLTVPPGVYTVRAEIAGFKDLQRSHVVVQAREPPPPASKISDLFWNSWVTTATAPEQPVERVQAGSSYVVSFDLSPYKYDSFKEDAATTSTDVTLAEALEAAGDTLRMRVYAVLGGEGLQFSTAYQPAQLVRFQTAPLKSPGAARLAGESFTQFQKRVTGGQVDISVDAVAPGCAAISLSIWTASAQPVPQDYVTRRVAVADASGVSPDCTQGGRSLARPMTAKLVSLLSTDRGEKLAAAMHIFEMDLGTGVSHVVSHAVFVSGKGSWSWRLREDVSRLIVDRTSMLRSVAHAHQGNGYGPLMRALTDALFPVNDPSATKALAVLKSLPAEPRSNVFARLVDLTGRARVLPLGLVDAGDGMPLGARVNIVAPLPTERIRQPDTCVAAWTLVLPETFDHTVAPVCTATVPGDAVRTWPEFDKYLRATAEPAVSEGLLLVAHHSAGTISFSQSGPAWARTSNVSRQYAHGSAAILVACSAAAEANQYGDTSWLTFLNERGVDVEIASPFEVPIDFGVCFGRHLASRVLEASGAKAPVSIADVFRYAVDDVRRDHLKSLSASDRAMADIAYEFVIAGNSELSICTAPSLWD